MSQLFNLFKDVLITSTAVLNKSHEIYVTYIPFLYADDSQLYIVINPRSDRSAFLTKIELCVSDVFTCCTNNGLACNPGKTEVVHFRSCHARTCEPIKTITVGNAAISAMPVVRDLGALLDQHLLLKKQINNICKGAWYVIQKIGRIRPY